MMSTTNPEYTSKAHRSIGWLLIASLLFIRIGIVGTIASFGPNDLLGPMFEVSTYILVAIFIWWERDHLEEFHIDGIALILILILKPIETLILSDWRFDTLITFPKPLSLVLWIVPLLLSISLAFSKCRFPKVRINIVAWIIIGILSGILTTIPLGYLLSFQIKPNELPYTLAQFFRGTSPLLFIYQAGYAGISEEPLFRGLLWGYMRRASISNLIILFVQTLLFMLGHIYYIKSAPISFFIVVPVGAIVCGILAWRSRSIATSIAAHSTVNAIGYQMAVLFASIRM